MSAVSVHLALRRVGIAVKASSAQAVELGKQVLAQLVQRGLTPVADADSASALGLPPGPPRGELGEHVDLVIVVGGDGTLLSVSRGCPAATPVAGINMGTLGFLTEHASQHASALVADLVDGEVLIERRDRLRVVVEGVGKPREFRVLNDVVINKAALARILVINVEVGGEFLSRYRADGLILATPTGSTAYNLSAGGPIVHPVLAALLITPICPHTLTNRPLAVPIDQPVRVWIESGDEGVYLTLDGQLGLPIHPGTEIRVSRSDQPLSLVRERSASFFAILHQKLKWGDRES
jgi:NAD+ kinase